MRDKIIEAIATTLQPLDFVLALWQGGSAASGYTDEWSDIDLHVIVKDDRVEETFEIFDTSLQTISEIQFKYRIPEPTWHRHSQCFYQLAEVNPFLAIDFVVMQLSNPNHFLEVERHGKGVIEFDKDNLLVPPPLNLNQHFSQMQARFKHLKKTFGFMQIFVKKEINRKHFVEAVAGYHNYTLNALVELLGIAYRPYKYDYKFRYISRDFPAEIVARLESLFCVKDLNDLINKQQLAEAMFTETLQRAEEVLSKEATADLIYPQ